MGRIGGGEGGKAHDPPNRKEGRVSDPLTPADCDLRGLEWMPLYGARLLTSETWLRATPEARCAALTLWWASWHQVPAASLADDDLLLSQLAGYGVAGVKQWRRIRDQAMRGWIKCSDGRLYHPTVAALACEAWDRRVKERARKAAWRAGRNADGDGDKGDMSPGQERGPDAAVPADITGQDRTGQEVRKEERKVPPSAAAVPAAVEQPIVELQLDAEPIDARTRLFRDGLARVRALSGKSEPQVRSLLGRWLKAAGDDASRVTRLIDQAEDLRPAEPIAWIEAGLRGRSDPFLATIRADLSGASTPAIAAETPIETMLRLERANRH